MFRQLKGVPKSRVYRILRKGEVRVNKGRIKPEYRLCAGDVIRIPPINVAEPKAVHRPSEQSINELSRSIIFEDDRLLVLNKPSGIAVHGGSGLSYGVIEALRYIRTDLRYLELIHRLDRETSGCLLIAKKRSALRQIHELFRNGGIEKQYQTLVLGDWPGGTKKIEFPLKKREVEGGGRVVVVDPAGKSAASIFSMAERYGDYTLMAVRLLTGRTHQIRVHAAHSGFPIAGDDSYGDRAQNRALKKLGLKRLFLHCCRMAFTLPDESERRVYDAPLDANLLRVLEKMSVEK